MPKNSSDNTEQLSLDTVNELTSMSRAELEAQLVAEKGEDWVKENKALLDEQWEYIESL